MGMEELTKTQLILLALLVSFVTSIATGIVTVTLLDQAPPGVTQTINRVVERTVEKVVPGQTASVITKETTVVVKEENLIIDAVEKNSKNLVRIALGDEKGELGKGLGVGVIVSADGLIVTDVLNLTDSKKYLIQTSSGKVFNANFDSVDGDLAFLSVSQTGDAENLVKFTKPSFGDTGNIKLGQTVVAIGGLSSNSVLSGLISRIDKKTIEVPKTESTSTSTQTQKIEVVSNMVSNISIPVDYSGGPLIDVDGFLLGLNMARKDGSYSIPINFVIDIVSKKLENAQKTEKKS
jgi:hypothetical protein